MLNTNATLAFNWAIIVYEKCIGDSTAHAVLHCAILCYVVAKDVLYDLLYALCCNSSYAYEMGTNQYYLLYAMYSLQPIHPLDSIQCRAHLRLYIARSLFICMIKLHALKKKIRHTRVHCMWCIHLNGRHFIVFHNDRLNCVCIWYVDHQTFIIYPHSRHTNILFMAQQKYQTKRKNCWNS